MKRVQSPNLKLRYRHVRAINDDAIKKFINIEMKNLNNLNKIFYDANLSAKFLDEYLKWILKSNFTKLKNLKLFPFKCFSLGATQSFDYFYALNKNRRFRAFKGEYMYHFTTWRNFYKWKYIEDGPLTKNDAVVISIPFSDHGDLHPQTNEVIKICNKLNIPVLIDCCYANVVKKLSFDFNKKSIKVITFSLGKYFPIAKLRIGMRLTRSDDDDPLFFQNKIDYINKLGCYIGLKLIKKFDSNYIIKKYKAKQSKINKKLGLLDSNVILFGLGDNNWKMYNRGGEYNRLCITSLLDKNN